MSMREPNARPSITVSSIASTVPSTGEYTSVPAGAPTSSDDVDGPCPPGSWYQRGDPVDEPKIACTTRFRTPSFAWVPSGESASAPAAPPWYPIVVTRDWLTGSCTCNEPRRATISGEGGPAGSRRAALAG